MPNDFDSSYSGFIDKTRPEWIKLSKKVREELTSKLGGIGKVFGKGLLVF